MDHLHRHIFRQEEVQIVHGHSAFSSLAHEALFVGSLMGLGTIFTDHSLFGFADASAIVTNTFLKYSLVNTSHCICVSHTGKENTVLRSGVPKSNIFVIPNAVDATMFEPDYERRRPPDKVVVVLGSRLVYRKGIDLVAEVIPRICGRVFGTGIGGEGGGLPVTVDFIVAGDGPKRILLEEAIETFGLQSRVKMLGELRLSQMRDSLLVKGDIFLNTSLTEAFCMAIVEAASCGLLVVSTKVGGIPEVLPEELIHFVEPDASSIEDGLITAVKRIIGGQHVSKRDAHEFIKKNYTWRDVP